MKKVAIHSAPRSGSSWVGSTFDSSPNVAYRYQPLFSYSHKNQLKENSTKEEIELFFNSILQTDDEFVLQKKSISEEIAPFFKKEKITHIAYKEVRYHYILENLIKNSDGIKIIGIIRHPCSVINSWLKAPKEFRRELGWKVSNEWRYASRKNKDLKEEFNGFEKWKEVSMLFLRLAKSYSSNFYLLRYKDLITSTEVCVRELFSFCGLNVTSQTLDFIRNGAEKTYHPYSVFNKKTNDDKWKAELEKYIIDEIYKDLIGTVLEQFLI